ncbi:MAG: RNA-binding cell elongation regulator Jag/EloR [Acidimicrobiia bacterium]
MEWVETTGKTVDEAKDLALDQLGVDEQDAEFEVVEEPRTGLFGRLRGEARVRARVRPTQPRPKLDRRDRKGRPNRGGGNRTKGGKRPGDKAADRGRGPSEPGARRQPEAEAAAEIEATASAAATAASSTEASESTGPSGRSSPAGRRTRPRPQDDEETIEMSETELAAQGEVAREFLLDLLDAFGLEGDVAATPAEEGAVELAVTGPDLGLLIGPKGQTLQAIQELTRTALQRQHAGDVHAKVRVDVAGYRQRRREALERFVRQVAEDVKSSGVQKALEPMSPPDRKVVHDTVNTIDGVHTISEGEDTRRRVVIIPD